MIFIYLCRMASVASLVLLVVKVQRGGWSVLTVIAGLFFTLTMLWLGVAPQHRGTPWNARAPIALITVVGMAIFWLLA